MLLRHSGNQLLEEIHCEFLEEARRAAQIVVGVPGHDDVAATLGRGDAHKGDARFLINVEPTELGEEGDAHAHLHELANVVPLGALDDHVLFEAGFLAILLRGDACVRCGQEADEGFPRHLQQG